MSSSSFSSSSSQNSEDEQLSSYYCHKLPWSSQPLGAPLPNDAHACSVSLPTWASVVGYEEGNVQVAQALKCGYPRFVYHPYVLQLMQYVCEEYASPNKEEDCLILPSRAAALRCQAFLTQALYQKATIDVCDITGDGTTDDSSNNEKDIRVVDLDTSTNIHAVMFPAQTLAGMEAKAYWQHTGEIVSSRRAEVCLQELSHSIEAPVSDFCQYDAITTTCPSDDLNASNEQEQSPHSLVKDRIASLTHVPSDHVYLTTSGMSSIYAALLSSRRTIGSSKASIVFGFPYLDTLKLCSRTEFCKGGVEFFGHGHDHDLNALAAFLETRQVCALFTEIPSNPLLQCPNLDKLRELTDKHNVCLVVDDTIGNFMNLDLLTTGLADVVCTSLTKLFSGRGDAMAGSLIANPHTRIGTMIQQDLQQRQEESSLFESDAWAIWHNSHSFQDRNARINETASQLADYLMEHPDVDQIYYPKYTSSLYTNYASASGDSCYGGLFSILLDSHICQRTFYDALDVAKGPVRPRTCVFTLKCCTLTFSLPGCCSRWEPTLPWPVPIHFWRIIMNWTLPCRTMSNPICYEYQWDWKMPTSCEKSFPPLWPPVDCIPRYLPTDSKVAAAPFVSTAQHLVLVWGAEDSCLATIETVCVPPSRLLSVDVV